MSTNQFLELHEYINKLENENKELREVKYCKVRIDIYQNTYGVMGSPVTKIIKPDSLGDFEDEIKILTDAFNPHEYEVLSKKYTDLSEKYNRCFNSLTKYQHGLFYRLFNKGR